MSFIVSSQKVFSEKYFRICLSQLSSDKLLINKEVFSSSENSSVVPIVFIFTSYALPVFSPKQKDFILLIAWKYAFYTK